MAWVKLDDNISDHPKILAAGPLASWLFVCGLTYCARHMTDGFIPAHQVPRLTSVTRSKPLADKLVAVSLWIRCEYGYMVHDYLDYQPSAQRIRQERTQTSTRQSRFRSRSNGVTNASHNALETPPARADPVPSHPIPVKDPGPSPARMRAREIDSSRFCSACKTKLPRRRPVHGLCPDCHGKALIGAKQASVDVMHISLEQLAEFARRS